MIIWEDTLAGKRINTRLLRRTSFQIISACDGRFMVLDAGLQWGRGPRDEKSGASSETFASPADALKAIDDRIGLQDYALWK